MHLLSTSPDHGDTLAPVFSNPLVSSQTSSPDPWLTYKDGFYYFCISLKDGIWVWKSPTLSGIDQGEKVRVWSPPASGPQSKHVWAPELHFLQGRWYIYYAADDGDNANHRMYVLESLTDDPQGEYQDRGRICSAEDKWAIDGTVLERPDGSLYFIWSGWPGYRDGLQNLYIAPMSNPWTISGRRVLISTPWYDWESWINEGPQVLVRDGLIHIIYSANESWTSEYCLGMLTCPSGDVLNPEAWVKQDRPVFRKYTGPEGGVFCVGHCSFVKSPDLKEDWIIYHAKDTALKGWEGRRAYAQKFGWFPDGTPDFGTPVPHGVPVLRPSGELALVEAETALPVPA